MSGDASPRDDGARLGESEHVPVLLQEAMEALQPSSPKSYIDATVGLGGHAQAILEWSSPDGRLLALDADSQALERARARLARFGSRVVFAQAWHSDLAETAQGLGFAEVEGILLDLGMSSLQLDEAQRGFSFQQDGPLDMRMNPEADLTADDLVNDLAEEELSRIIYEYGEERHARRIARAICAQRPIRSTRELAALIERLLGHGRRIHPATRTFQALRIAVNRELASLEAALPQAIDLLAPGGHLVVIAFHSLEDRIVKQFMQQESRDCICPPRIPQCVCGHRAILRRVTRKPIRPSEDEIRNNPRSRSARMRVAERLALVT
jgi:16S rRNA (cytosine1402-N4)-methyltransferase